MDVSDHDVIIKCTYYIAGNFGKVFYNVIWQIGNFAENHLIKNNWFTNFNGFPLYGRLTCDHNNY